jgi:hypothetical protein
MKILRRIYGPVQEVEFWRPRWNNKLYRLYKESNIVDDVKIRRLGWAGHIIRWKMKGFQKEFSTETSIPQYQWEDQEPDGQTWFRAVFPKLRAAARYRALASIIPGRER